MKRPKIYAVTHDSHNDRTLTFVFVDYSILNPGEMYYIKKVSGAILLGYCMNNVEAERKAQFSFSVPVSPGDDFIGALVMTPEDFYAAVPPLQHKVNFVVHDLKPGRWYWDDSRGCPFFLLYPGTADGSRWFGYRPVIAAGQEPRLVLDMGIVDAMDGPIDKETIF